MIGGILRQPLSRLGLEDTKIQYWESVLETRSQRLGIRGLDLETDLETRPWSLRIGALDLET